MKTDTQIAATPALAVAPCSLFRVWKSAHGTPAPVEKWCKERGWPNRTTDGDLMYENLFFADLAKAWEHHVAEHEAGLKFDTRRAKQLKADLAAAMAAVAESAILLCDVKQAHAEFLKANSRDQGRADSAQP